MALTADIALIPGRVHELCGPARRTLAAMLAARMDGPVLWIRQNWRGLDLHTDGLAPWFNPGRLLLVDCAREEDLLWVMEESLRAGCAPLVVTDFAQGLALTPVRRLHLAAEAGAEKASAPPLGLILSPGEGGSQGVESRWSLQASPAWIHDLPPRWQISRLRSRLEPPRQWTLTRDRRDMVVASEKSAQTVPA